LAKILNSGSAYKIKQVLKKKKKNNDGYDEEMDEIVAAPVNPDKEKDQNEDEESGEEDSQGYGEMEEEEEDEQEMAAEIEKQRLLDLFVEELPDEIIISSIPEDQ
jgi:chromatin remodeling complex protein RSC6